MISGQWFYRRFFKNWPKILTNLVGVHPRNIHTKFEANPCSGLRGEVEKLKSSRRQRRRRTQPDR